MSNIQRVIIELDDRISILEGDEAKKWNSHVVTLSTMAAMRSGNQNPFDHDPVHWNVFKKSEE